MRAADFLDTNVIIYAWSADAARKSVALDLLAGSPVISTQVLNEAISVCRRKHLMPDAAIGRAIDDLAAWCRVSQIDMDTIKLALNLTNRYQFSYYDALIVASALEAECATLYSEDMQHGQVIDEALKIVNPFLPA
ncbi:MAG: PIN domain-containing protein [Burkholderiaceae bacterium]|jgi:predicted nucleic acid-binding protein|nr:PIN domain-containing protein [Burkholderiaceae bacterium]